METAIMETERRSVAPTACHGAQTPRSALSRWRFPLIAGGAAVIAGIGVALGQQWLTVAAVAPVLYALPCALMMFVCMRHMNHGQQAEPTPAVADRNERATSDARS